MTLGENIKMLRESKYMSIFDVEEITGLSKSTISQLERDILNPTLDMMDTLNKIAHALHITTDRLLLH
jgi:transcriptional regulator with XRE-family HTH domain